MPPSASGSFALTRRSTVKARLGWVVAEEIDEEGDLRRPRSRQHLRERGSGDDHGARLAQRRDPAGMVPVAVRKDEVLDRRLGDLPEIP